MLSERGVERHAQEPRLDSLKSYRQNERGQEFFHPGIDPPVENLVADPFDHFERALDLRQVLAPALRRFAFVISVHLSPPFRLLKNKISCRLARYFEDSR